MGVNVAFVLFAEPTALNGAEIVANLQALRPSVGDIDVDGSSVESNEPQVFETDDGMVTFTDVAAPLPWDDLEGPCATSMLWRNAEDDIKPHQGHAIVAVMDELEPIESARLLTHATTALLDAHPNALGVYWGNAGLVIPRNIFVEFTKEIMPEAPPLHIWVDIRVGPITEQTSTGFTQGMAALGLMDIETKYATEPFTELRQRFESLIHYLLENGLVINNGDTVGEHANERIRVMYSESMYGHEEQVMRLEYEGESDTAMSAPVSKKPWWKFW